MSIEGVPTSKRIFSEFCGNCGAQLHRQKDGTWAHDLPVECREPSPSMLPNDTCDVYEIKAYFVRCRRLPSGQVEEEESLLTSKKVVFREQDAHERLVFDGMLHALVNHYDSSLVQGSG